jgi:hypothetical protein
MNFINHNSALHPRKALVLFATPAVECPAVPLRLVDVKREAPKHLFVALLNAGIEVHATVAVLACDSK